MDAGASPCPHSHFSSWGTKGRVPHGARPFVVLVSLTHCPRCSTIWVRDSFSHVLMLFPEHAASEAIFG